MSTEDQILSSELHGEVLLTARRPELQPLIDHLREVAEGRDDIRTECAGTIAGSWFASGVRCGEDLIAAGLLMLAGLLILTNLTGGCGLVGSVAAGQMFRTARPANRPRCHHGWCWLAAFGRLTSAANQPSGGPLPQCPSSRPQGSCMESA
jgi:hypothetical protein